MAARNFNTPRCLVREQIVLAGRFTGNGATALDATLQRGLGFAATRTGVGKYRVTFTDTFNELTSFTCSAFGAKFLCVTRKILSGKIVDIEVWDAAGAALELAATEGVDFIACFKNSAVAPGRGS